jgi:hypothetical protein
MKIKGIVIYFVICLAGSQYISAQLKSKVFTADIIVYGGTSAAVMACVQASKLGKTVVMVSPDKHLGGLPSGGLELRFFHFC